MVNCQAFLPVIVPGSAGRHLTKHQEMGLVLSGVLEQTQSLNHSWTLGQREGQMLQSTGAALVFIYQVPK